MKKIIVIVMVMSTLMVGCGRGETVKDSSPDLMKEITVNPIEVENTFVENITWENVEVETWD